VIVRGGDEKCFCDTMFRKGGDGSVFIDHVMLRTGDGRCSIHNLTGKDLLKILFSHHAVRNEVLNFLYISDFKLGSNMKHIPYSRS
jgi:hypothetical protein